MVTSVIYLICINIPQNHKISKTWFYIKNPRKLSMNQIKFQLAKVIVKSSVEQNNADDS